jgi:hypothetical protein
MSSIYWAWPEIPQDRVNMVMKFTIPQNSLFFEHWNKKQQLKSDSVLRSLFRIGANTKTIFPSGL